MSFVKLLLIFIFTEWLVRILLTGAYIFATAEAPKSRLLIYSLSVLLGLCASYWAHVRPKKDKSKPMILEDKSNTPTTSD